MYWKVANSSQKCLPLYMYVLCMDHMRRKTCTIQSTRSNEATLQNKSSLPFLTIRLNTWAFFTSRHNKPIRGRYKTLFKCLERTKQNNWRLQNSSNNPMSHLGFFFFPCTSLFHISSIFVMYINTIILVCLQTRVNICWE
jgi:hypothetical protein